MKLIIDIDEKIYKESKKECEENDSLIIDTFTYAIGNGIPLEFGNISVEAIEELSHRPACIHYVQGDVPSLFCEKCVNKDELYRRDELLDYVTESIEAEKKMMCSCHDLASEDYHKGIIYAFECMKMKLM